MCVVVRVTRGVGVFHSNTVTLWDTLQHSERVNELHGLSAWTCVHLTTWGDGRVSIRAERSQKLSFHVFHAPLRCVMCLLKVAVNEQAATSEVSNVTRFVLFRPFHIRLLCKLE